MSAVCELKQCEQFPSSPLALHDPSGELEPRYYGWLSITGNEGAAAILTLATVMQAGQHSRSGKPDGLLDMKQAAAYLGYDSAGLRKIAKQQKIRYVQNGHGPIKFRREWLDKFIAANTVGPKDIERAPAQKRSRPIRCAPSRIFDPALFYADSHSGAE
jgi:hypothetical protein